MKRIMGALALLLVAGLATGAGYDTKLEQRNINDTLWQTRLISKPPGTENGIFGYLGGTDQRPTMWRLGDGLSIQDGKLVSSGSGGVPGPVGPAGPIGPMGATGATGPQGVKGDTGDAGAQGIQGLQGAPGVKGDKGDTGSQGAQGIQGLKGDTGATGAAGATGPAGAQGLQGLKGDPGAVGPQGPQGVKGDTGATGLTGPAGAAGAQGPIGLTGPQGPSGATGATGPKGDTGATGETGPQGTPGITRRIETYTRTTNAAGQVVVTYPTAYPVVPVVQLPAPALPNQVWTTVSSTTTGFTMQLNQRNTVTLLAVEVLLGATVPVNGTTATFLVVAQ